MKRMMTFVCALLAATTLVAQTHPLTFDDMASIRRIGPPQLSPDGRWIAYQGTNVDLPGNKSRAAIYLMPSSGGTSRQISDGASKDEGPVWSADGKKIAWVSNREGGVSQIYVYDVVTGSTRKISNLPGGASSLKWLPDGSGFVAVSDVYPDCGVEPDCAKSRADMAAAAPTKARVIDSLLYRHWNQWSRLLAATSSWCR